ncbi:MAG: ATP-binding protein [Burkholderiaceae bacterium]
MFDRLWRKDAARSNARHAGLGLALVQAYADQLGLSVSASAEGGLLTITLSGPVNGRAPEPAQAL